MTATDPQDPTTPAADIEAIRNDADQFPRTFTLTSGGVTAQINRSESFVRDGRTFLAIEAWSQGEWVRHLLWDSGLAGPPPYGVTAEGLRKRIKPSELEAYAEEIAEKVEPGIEIAALTLKAIRALLEDGLTSQALVLLDAAALVGQRVRSFDFDGRDLTGDRACYVEGVVEGITDPLTDRHFSDCPRYKIRVDRVIWQGQKQSPRGAGPSESYPPINGTPRLFGDETSGVEVIR